MPEDDQVLAAVTLLHRAVRTAWRKGMVWLVGEMLQLVWRQLVVGQCCLPEQLHATANLPTHQC